MSSSEMIDFVITWVDGNDPEWLRIRKTYENKGENNNIDNSEQRYRDWNNLQYWFRGVEFFCPWVNRIHFVTWGHLPEWLNVSNPKLNIVRHEDYIPKKYLPTFSSHTIELNLHRIKGLSDRFVYFNDDMFVIRNMTSGDFFHKGIPCDSAIMSVHCYNMEEMFVMAPFRDIGIINHEYNMKRTIKSNLFGWYNPKYGFNVLRNIVLLACPRFPGMLQQHLPSSFLKSTFEEVWDKYGDILDETCTHKFREISDVNQWVFKEWQIASNKFYPRNLRVGTSLAAYDIPKVCKCIEKQQHKMFCFNDTNLSEIEFEDAKFKVNCAFERILNKKSSFEI